MRFDELYRDVYSQLNLTGNEDIFSLDIINALNQAIRSVRAEYIQNGLGDYFSMTEVIYAFIEDFQYPFLRIGDLEKSVTNDVPINIGVIAASALLTKNKIKNETQTFNEGDIAEKDGFLYEAIRDVTDENTFTKVFDSDNLRMYSPGNNLKYRKGDVVLNINDNKYYFVDTTFISDGSETLQEVVWRKIGRANTPVSVYPLHLLTNLSIHNFERQAISVVDNKVYANPEVEQLTITYIPKWDDVTDRNQEINLPDNAVPAVVNRATQKLLIKLGKLAAPDEN